MNKLLLIPVITLLFVSSVTGQGVDTRVVTFGAKVGTNLTKNYGFENSVAEYKLGFAFGGFVTFNLASQFAIEPGVLFTMKGWELEDISKVKLNYVEIPVLLKFYIPSQGNIKPNIFAGPALGILLSARVDDDDIKHLFNSTDFGVVLGGGIDVTAERGKFIVEARSTVGLVTIESDDEYWGGKSVSKNIAFTVMLGYAF